MPRRQMQQVDDARRVYAISNPAGQAPRLELRNKQAVSALWQIVVVDELDFAIAGRHARQQLSELFGKGWLKVGQLSSQLVAFGLDPIIDELTSFVFFLRLHFLKPLPQSGHGGLQTLAPKCGVLHLAASFRNVVGR
jgi:hypothetical protein